MNLNELIARALNKENFTNVEDYKEVLDDNYK